MATSIHGPDTRPTSDAFAAAQKGPETIEQADAAQERETDSGEAPLPPDPQRYLRIRTALGMDPLTPDRTPTPGFEPER